MEAAMGKLASMMNPNSVLLKMPTEHERALSMPPPPRVLQILKEAELRSGVSQRYATASRTGSAESGWTGPIV